MDNWNEFKPGTWPKLETEEEQQKSVRRIEIKEKETGEVFEATYSENFETGDCMVFVNRDKYWSWDFTPIQWRYLQ